MGSKYPVLKPRVIIRALEKLGFSYKSQKGSHLKYVKDGDSSKVAIIPEHDVVAKGTLKSILDKSGISLEEFLENI